MLSHKNNKDNTKSLRHAILKSKSVKTDVNKISFYCEISLVLPCV